MKYSNYVGVAAALVLIGCCFLPWVYIDSIPATITGLKTEPTKFGRPGILHIIFSVLSIILFLLPFTWAKSANLFMATFNFAWSLRNFLLIPLCEMGECPQKLAGMYAIIIVSPVILAMALMPKVTYKYKE